MKVKRIKLSNILSLSHYAPAIAAVILMLISLTASIVVLWTAILASILIVITFKTNIYLRRVIISAFFLRVFLIFVDENFGLIPYQWDGYFNIAVAIKQNLIEGVPIFNGVNPPGNTKAYSLLASFQYLILGNINAITKTTNGFFASMVILRIYQLGLKLFDSEKVALRAALLFAFLPSFIIYSSLDLRDSLILLVSIDILYRVIQYSDSKKMGTLLFLIIEMVLMDFLRGQNVALYLFVFLIYLLTIHFYHRPFGYKLTATVLLMFVLFVFLNWLDHAGISEKIFSYANLVVDSRDWGGSAYLQGFQYNTWFDVFKNLPIRFFYFTFGPLPWDINNIFMLLSFFEVLFILAFAIFTVNFLRVNNGLNRHQLLLLIFCLIGLAANSLLDSNYGTAIRHRLNYIFVFFMFGSAYLQRYRIKFL